MTAAENAPDVLTDALAYAGRGWAVFPVRGKVPVLDLAPHWSQDSTTDPAVITAWFTGPGSAEFGVAIDLAKSGLCVVDGDHLEHLDFRDRLTGWQYRGNRDRMSWLYSVNGHPVPQAAHPWGEVKSAGGYVVMPPSPHETGVAYEWLPNPPPIGEKPPLLPVDIEVLIAPKFKPKAASGASTHRSGRTGPVGPARSSESVHWTPGDSCPAVGRCLAEWLDAMPGNRHPALRGGLMALTRLGEQGHEGVRAAVDSLTAEFDVLTQVDQARPLDRGEWDRLVVDLDQKIADEGLTAPSDIGCCPPEAPASAGPGPLPDGAEPVQELVDPKLKAEIDKQWYLAEAKDEVARRRAERDAAKKRASRVRRTMEQAVQEPPPKVIIEEVLAAEVCVLAGLAGSGKSLIARDWALHVAAGVPWRGYDVHEPRGVLWIASEGMHDLAKRWPTQPLWQAAKGRIEPVEPIDLRTNDVDWLLAEYADMRPGLVVFDLIYACGVGEENNADEVRPIIAAMRRISAAWSAATLAIGHPPLSGARRMRGAGVWHDEAYSEWFADGDTLASMKSKIADSKRLGGPYVVEYPHVRWLNTAQATGRAATKQQQQHAIIRADITADPGASTRARAKRLKGALDLSEGRTRALISAVLDDLAAEVEQ